MTETRTATLTNQIVDISGQLVVTYVIDGGQIETIKLAYETDERKFDPYTVSYEHMPVPSVRIVTPNTSFGFPEIGRSAAETWEHATAYYLSNGVLPHLRLTAAQREESVRRFVEPLSQAVRSLSEDTAQLRAYPSQFCGQTRFEVRLANGQLQLGDTLDLRLCDPTEAPDRDA